MESQWGQVERVPSSPMMSSCLPESCLQIIDIRPPTTSKKQFQVLVRDSTDNQMTEYWMSSNALIEDPELWDSAWYTFCAQTTAKKAMCEYLNRIRSTVHQNENEFIGDDIHTVKENMKRKRKQEESASKKSITTAIQETPSGQQLIRVSLQGKKKKSLISPFRKQSPEKVPIVTHKKASVSPSKSPRSLSRVASSPEKIKQSPIKQRSPPKKFKPDVVVSPIEKARDILQKPGNKSCRLS